VVSVRIRRTLSRWLTRSAPVMLKNIIRRIIADAAFVDAVICIIKALAKALRKNVKK